MFRFLWCWLGWHCVVDDGQENNPKYLRCQWCKRQIEVYL